MVFQNYALYPHMTVVRQHGVRAQAGARCRKDEIDAAGRARRPRMLDLDELPRPQAPASSRAASGSASRWAGPSCATRRCS